MIAVILVMCGLVFLTMNYAQEHELISDKHMLQNINGDETPPEIPNDSYLDTDESSENNNEALKQGDPSEKTDEELDPFHSFQNNSTESASREEVPPAKPDGKNNSSYEDLTLDENMPNIAHVNVGLSYIYYLIFSVEGLIISGLLIYLVLSKFNKKSLKETFANSDKMMIYILSVIVLTSGLSYSSGKITENCFLNKSNNVVGNNPNEPLNSSISYSSVMEITEDISIDHEDFSSAHEDENAILISGNITSILSDMRVDKTGDSNGGDNTSFYGINSAILAKDGAQLTLKNITVTTDAVGANGVFSYGGSATTDHSTSDDTTVMISDSIITTMKDNSGGIMTTGGGVTKASNLTIHTAGMSSAAIRTDKGGGTVTVDGGTYTTTGQGSPTIYSTADVSVSHATLVAEASEGIVVEGKNTVTIHDCDLTDSNTQLNGLSTTYKNIFLYQSMSGDAAEGQAQFTAIDSMITTNQGDSFYVTNTTATIVLENNTIVNNDVNGNFLRVQKDSWGNSGENGGKVTLTMKQQKGAGCIVIDSISTLDMNMELNSYYEGVINGDNSAQSIKLSLDKTSKIKLTGDSYISFLDDEDSNYDNIDFNGYKLYVNGQAIN